MFTDFCALNETLSTQDCTVENVGGGIGQGPATKSDPSWVPVFASVYKLP